MMEIRTKEGNKITIAYSKNKDKTMENNNNSVSPIITTITHSLMELSPS
jgi:hypothetical protein